MSTVADWHNIFQFGKKRIEASNWAGAVSCFDELLENDSYVLPDKTVLSIHRRLAEAHLCLSNLDKALNHASIAIETSNEAVERDYIRKSRILDFLGQSVEARDLLVEYGTIYIETRKADNQNDQITRKNIVVLSLPKSGSTSLSAALAAHLAYDYVEFPNRQDTKFFSNSIPVMQCFKQISNMGVVMHTHMLPNQKYVDFLAAQDDIATILHLRDPREALVSALDMVHRQSPYQIISKVPKLLDMSLHEQLSWMLKNYLPSQVNWIKRWLHFADSRTDTNIKLSEFSDLKENGQDAVAIKLIEDLGLKPSKVETVTQPRRIGRRIVEGEWKELLSSEQKKSEEAAIPSEVRERFGWE